MAPKNLFVEQHTDYQQDEMHNDRNSKGPFLVLVFRKFIDGEEQDCFLIETFHNHMATKTSLSLAGQS